MDPMQVSNSSSSHSSARRVRKRHRHSRLKTWLARNAPNVFLYVAGAMVALATTYWLVRDGERNAAQGSETTTP